LLSKQKRNEKRRKEKEEKRRGTVQQLEYKTKIEEANKNSQIPKIILLEERFSSYT